MVGARSYSLSYQTLLALHRSHSETNYRRLGVVRTACCWTGGSGLQNHCQSSVSCSDVASDLLASDLVAVTLLQHCWSWDPSGSGFLRWGSCSADCRSFAWKYLDFKTGNVIFCRTHFCPKRKFVRENAIMMESWCAFQWLIEITLNQSNIKSFARKTREDGKWSLSRLKYSTVAIWALCDGWLWFQAIKYSS